MIIQAHHMPYCGYSTILDKLFMYNKDFNIACIRLLTPYRQDLINYNFVGL